MRFNVRQHKQKTHVFFKPASLPFASARRSCRPADVIIPTDLFLSAWRQLFPAERMLVLGGRRLKRGVRITSATDVTEAKPSRVHVWADPAKLVQSLLDLERSGAHLALWMHSHPGTGPLATHPSQTDLRQEEELRRYYSELLVCVIAVSDGYFRIWGRAVDEGLVQIRFQGAGVHPHSGEQNVYRLQLS